MSINEYYLKKYSREDTKYFVSRIFELIERAEKGKKVIFTDFLDPLQRRIAMEITGHYGIVNAAVNGGLEEAERGIIAFHIPDINVNPEEFPISFIKIEDKGWGKELSHRDYLGALLAAGIKREKIGDLVVREKICWVVVHRDIEEYLLMNLDRVGRNVVEVRSIKNIDDLPVIRFKEIKSTVASLRLDAAVGAAFNLSRNNALKYIRGDKAKLNWELCVRPDAVLQEGDVVSVRGKGKFKIKAITGSTRKGRTGVIINKYI